MILILKKFKIIKTKLRKILEKSLKIRQFIYFKIKLYFNPFFIIN